MNLKRSAITLSLALCLIGAGCGNDTDAADAITEPGVQAATSTEPTDASAEDSSATTEPPAQDGGEEEPDSSDTSTTTSETAIDSSDAAEPLASLDMETSGSKGEAVTLRIDVLSLQRNDDSVLLSFQINNLSDADYALFDHLAEEPNDYGTASGVSLVDLDNNKRYLTLIDSEGNCVCTNNNGSIESVNAQTALTMQASFPAPPKDVTSVDVDLRGLGVIGDVPLESA